MRRHKVRRKKRSTIRDKALLWGYIFSSERDSLYRPAYIAKPISTWNSADFDPYYNRSRTQIRCLRVIKNNLK